MQFKTVLFKGQLNTVFYSLLPAPNNGSWASRWPVCVSAGGEGISMTSSPCLGSHPCGLTCPSPEQVPTRGLRGWDQLCTGSGTDRLFYPRFQAFI